MKKQLFLGLFALLWSLFFLLPACKKAEPRTVHIKGRVTEYGTGTPIVGARIYMLCDNSVVLGGSSSSLTDSLVTDSDGRFDRTYADEDLCGSLYLLPYKAGYFKGTEIDLTTEFRELDIVLDPEAWLKIRCIADSNSTSMHFQVENHSQDVNISFGEISYPYLGGVPLHGGRTSKIYWTLYPSVTKHQDDIYLTPHDTTTYTIHY